MLFTIAPLNASIMAAASRRRNLEKSKKQMTFSSQEKYFRKSARTERGMEDGKQKFSLAANKLTTSQLLPRSQKLI